MAKTTKKHLLKKKTIVSIIFLVVVIVAAAGYIIFTSLSQPVQESQVPVSPEKKVDEIVAAVKTDSDKKGAQQQLKKLADTETNTDKKIVYLSGASDLYFDSGDYKSALGVAKTIEQLDKSSLSAGNIAEAYSQLGDFANAAKYYQIAASRSEKPAFANERTPYNDYMILKREAEAKL